MSVLDMTPSAWTYLLDVHCGSNPTDADWMWRLAFAKRWFT